MFNPCSIPTNRFKRCKMRLETNSDGIPRIPKGQTDLKKVEKVEITLLYADVCIKSAKVQ